MVLTPSFRVTQTDELVVISITLPHIRVSNAEIITEGPNFSFYCKPYLLKLTFPGQLQDGEDAHRALYDPDINNGTLTVELKKQTCGEHFADLDLITKLLKTRKLTEMTPDIHEIEVLHNENFVDENDEDENNHEVSTDGQRLVQKVAYGFNYQYSRVFNHLKEMIVGVLDINEPDKHSAKQRYRLRIAQEYADFDAARYLGDFLDAEQDSLYVQMMDYKPFWIVAWESSETSTKANAEGGKKEEDNVFDEQEQEILRSKLKNREYLIPANGWEETRLLVNLIDILFAFCYDVRMTEGEANHESPANIARLSRQFSWLDSFLPDCEKISSETMNVDLKDIETWSQTVITLSMRRLLTYPYLRYWKLGRKILADVARILLLGKRYILKCLLRLFYIFERTDNFYLMNKIFLQDYCVWIQTVSDGNLRQLAKAFNNAKNRFEQTEKGKAGKRWVGFHIPELDAFGQRLLECDNEENEANQEAEPDEIPSEYLDYSDIFDSDEPELSYLRVPSDAIAEDLKSPMENTGIIDDIETARAELQAMLLSPSNPNRSVDNASNKLLIEEVNDAVDPQNEQEEEVPADSKRTPIFPPTAPETFIPTLSPSVAEDIQNALLDHLTQAQEDSATHASDQHLEEMLLASMQQELGDGSAGPQPLTSDDVKQLFASVIPGNAADTTVTKNKTTGKKLLIEELSSTTFDAQEQSVDTKN